MKKILIVGWDVGQNSIGVTRAYAEHFQRFGDVEILMPNTINTTIRTDVDLLVLPGGADVDTKRYNQAPSLGTGKSNDFLEWFDVHILPHYIEARVPIIGICRGMQSLNVHFGGSLHQEMEWTGHERSVKHRGELVNTLEFPRKYSDFKTHIFGREKPKVNSIHHQSVDRLGEGLEVVAYCSEHIGAGEPFVVVEAFRHLTLPIWGFQYHPEEIYDRLSDKVIRDLLSSTPIFGGEEVEETAELLH